MDQGVDAYKQGDFEQALNIFSQLAEDDNAVAQFNLGVMYDNGQGVRQSNKKAFSLVEKSAELGFSEAQFNLGLFYINRIGVRKFKQKAIYWYKKAAAQGDADAVESLKKLGVKFE
ncbi:MAG: sel1 repeat family protein [Robiginitomaculum sp.]|nr:sel1 repeat family protein [Robiginitomaculum sp.]